MIATRRALLLRAAAAAILVVGAGCSVTRPATVKELFVLEPANPAPAAKAQPGLLRIGTIQVGAPFRGRGFVYRETELQYESDYYHEFLVSPAANIGEATARALSAAKVFAAVAPAGIVLEPDWVLEGFVDALYGDARDKAKPASVLTITYFLRRGDGDGGVPVWTRRYDRRVPFVGGSATAYMTAQNGALGDILSELARDLSALTLPAR